MLLPVGLSYNENRERTVSVESVTNMQPEVTIGGRQQVALITCPGLTQFADSGIQGVGRGIISINGNIYAVVGSSFIKIQSNGTVTIIGLIDGSGPVRMSASSVEIHIAVFDTGYIFNLSSETLTQITDTDYPQGRATAYIGGRFVTESPDPGTSDRFYYSGLLNGGSWEGLDFATAERKTDDVINLSADSDTLNVYGTRSIEFWAPTATSFDPIPGAVLPYGLGARYSLAESSGVNFFLDSNGQVRALSGYQGQVVSTPAVEYALDKDSDAQGCAYVFEGKLIYEISRSNLTLCYDVTTSQLVGKPIWFKKETADSRWKGFGCVDLGTKLYQLGFDDSKIYSLDRATIPDVREFTIMIPTDDDNRGWSVIDELELIGRSGTGAIPDIDPQIMLRVSRDNGYTEGEEKWMGVGTVGQYAKRIRWRRFGRFRQCSLNFRQTDLYDWTVLGVRVRGR